MWECTRCTSANVVGVEYDGLDPLYYDGVSEWKCINCGLREGRWSGKQLTGDEQEKPYGKI